MVYDDAGKKYLQHGGDDGGDGGGSAEWWPDREAVQRGSTHCRHGDGRCCHHAMHARVAAQLQPLSGNGSRARHGAKLGKMMTMWTVPFSFFFLCG